jgi:hypothetical protein
MGKRVRMALAAGSLTVAMTVGAYIGAAWARQEEMDAALSDLHSARDHLQAAEHNKGGHRATALRYVDMAIDEVRAGIDDAR